MEPNQPFNPQQPQQPVNPVPAQPVMEPVQPAQPVQPVQPMSPVQPKKNNKNLILGIILGLIVIAIIILILVMFVFNKPNGQDSGSGNSGSSSNNSSNGSGDNSGDSSNYANAPDAIDSCPGCVYATSEKGKGHVYSKVAAEAGGYKYEPLVEENYSTSWKEIVENSGREIFYGYVLDDNKYAVRGFVCGIEKDTPFCIEGALTDSRGGNATTRQEIYAKNVEVLNSIYDNCVENTQMGAYYCTGDVDSVANFVDDFDLPGTVQMWAKGACLNATASGLGYTSTVSDDCKK